MNNVALTSKIKVKGYNLTEKAFFDSHKRAS